MPEKLKKAAHSGGASKAAHSEGELHVVASLDPELEAQVHIEAERQRVSKEKQLVEDLANVMWHAYGDECVFYVFDRPSLLHEHEALWLQVALCCIQFGPSEKNEAK